MRLVDATKLSVLDLLKKADEIASNARTNIPDSSISRAKIDTDEVVGGTVMLIAGLSLVLILGGTWRMLIPF
jgi:hypothetical protein